MVYQDGSGVPELAALEFTPLSLDNAKLIERFLELAGEAVAVKAKVGHGGDEGLGGGDLVKQVGLEDRNAVETPGSVGQFLDQLSFGCIGGLVFIEELAVMLFIRGLVLRWQDGGEGR